MNMCDNHSGLPSTRWPVVPRYEVFLSFRGGDVRRDFIQFLYRGLTDSGIDTFIDYAGIEIGEEIMPTILQVISQSKICIPVFSRGFASSKSCLKEVAKMVGCDRTIMPIFYDVTPSVVRYQQGSYGKSFRTHAKNRVRSKTIGDWEKALCIASEKHGWELKNFRHGEYELINEVVSTVRRLLGKDDLPVTAHLVGMNRPVQEVMEKLGVLYDDGKVVEGQTLMGKRVVEISGLPGIGKSTLAAVVYNKIHHLFEGKCFLKDICGEVEQRRLLSLQETLIGRLQKKTYTLKSPAQGDEFIKYKFRDLRVLIILDDVSEFEQIKSLAGDPNWFGQGSRIIVISTGSNLLKRYNQVPMTSISSNAVNSCADILVEKYELEQLNAEHAFQLFCKYALREPLHGGFLYLAPKITLAIGGIPQFIEIVGLSLRGEQMECWTEALGRLNSEPFSKEIERILTRRYEGLEKYAQQIFLDIACFFVGKEKKIPSYMWKACKYDPYIGIEALHNMSLVKTGANNEFWMHKQLIVFGRDIVKKENPSEPFNRSRLWFEGKEPLNQDDIEPILNEKKDAAVEALSATFDKPHIFLEHRFFENFSKLRYLKMNHAIVEAYEQSAEGSREVFFLRKLKWLEWHGCNDISSLLDLHLSQLIILDLSGSTSRSWQHWEQIMKKAKNLKVLILKGCDLLAESPVVHAPKNLERLNLEHCSTLPGVGRSISGLRYLVSLNIKFCSFVQKLPEDMGYLEALKELYIDGTSIEAIDFPKGSYLKLEILSACNCKSLTLSESIGNLKSLSYLALDDTEFRELPHSIGQLEKLQTLSLRNCRSLWKLRGSIGNLKELQLMDLSDTLVHRLPSSVKGLRNLKVLKMARTYIEKIPRGIVNLENLEEIDFSACISLKGPCDIRGLSSLRVLLLQDTRISRLIVMDRQLSHLQNLRLHRNVPTDITSAFRR